MAGLAEDIITNLRGEISQRKKEQLKQRPVGKPLDAAKTALTHAATLMTKRHQISRRTCSRLRIRNIRDVYC